MLTTAERERDEARRERDAVREQYAMSLEEHGELMRQREDTSSQLWDCMNERDGWKHRAERAERVVEAVAGLAAVDVVNGGEYYDDIAVQPVLAAYHRYALDAAEGSNA